MDLIKIQENLRDFMGQLNPKTEKARLIERTYIKALGDAGLCVPPICIILTMSGRSIVDFKPAFTK